jgi:LAGLIDADG-like domain
MWSPVPARFDDLAPSASYGSQKRVDVPAEMTEDLAFLLGAFAAEGHVTRSNWTVRITNSVPAVRDRVATAWRAVFGVTPRIVDDGARCPDVLVASKTIVEFLDHLGCGGRASEKRIPDAVLRSPREMVLAFLQGLALDAYVTNGAAPKWGICLDSPGLLDDLQAVLTNLGVLHSRVSKFNPVYGKSYDEVYACGDHAQHLIRIVPFLEPDKRVRAAELAGRAFTGRRNTSDVVPGITPRALYDLLPRGLSGRNGYGVRSEFAYLCDDRTRRVSRRTLERIAAVPGVELPPWLRTVLDDGLHFAPVESVADGGVRDVFDVSVPATHAFVGNGIVNHNTVNMPEEATVDEVEQLHIDAWRTGVKAIAIYRDNCKVGQPLSTSRKEATAAPDAAPESSGVLAQRATQVVEKIIKVPVREKLPRNRTSKTFEFRVADCKGFVTIGEYADGRPGEIFLKVSKQGSTLAGIMDAFSISVSYGLQYGVPLRNFVEAFTNTRFEPAGITDDPDLRIATSILDYIFRRLAVDYLSYEERAELGILTTGERTQPTLPGVEETVVVTRQGQDVPADPPSIDSSSPTLFDTSGAPKEPSLLERAGVTDAEKPGAGTPRSPVIKPTAASSVDAPYCMQCGVQMQRAGSCHACPSCGSTSGCS